MKEERYIREHRTDDVARLALQLSGRNDLDTAYILQQIEGWQRLRTKVPSWAAVDGLRYPPRLALEQCSGEKAARYKADVVERLLPEGATMVDLTGGLGVDFSFVAKHFREATYIERNVMLAEIAAHNFPLLGLEHAHCLAGDGTELLRTMSTVDLLFLDPARRDAAGRKTVLLEDCEPNVIELLPLFREKAHYVMLKLSPMLDLHRAMSQLDCTEEVHIVAERGECKDLLLVLNMQQKQVVSPTIFCCDEETFSFRADEESTALPAYASTPLRYLYEPNAAILKAGAYKLPAVCFGLQKFHPNSHLYTSDKHIENFPGRTFEVLRYSHFNKQELKAFKGDVRQANLTVRNFPASVAELRKRLKIKEGGDEYWFATTCGEDEHLLIACKKSPI